MNFIRRIPAVKGVYGERIVVNSKLSDIYAFFKLISVWSDNNWLEPDGTTTTMWELPIGISITNNELIKNAIKRANINVEEG